MSTGLHTTRLGESGSLLVFCHGLFGQGKNWTAIAKSFSDRHRVLLVDLPNHGRSTWTSHLDYLEMADALAGLLSASDPVTLVGHSMGGKAAMVLALRHPDLVDRLAVVDVSPVSYQHGEELGGYVDAMRRLNLESLNHRRDADRALAGAVPDPVVRSFLLQNLRHAHKTWSWRPNLALIDLELDRVMAWPEDRVSGSYPGPVLWLGGDSSTYIRDEHEAVMGELFPRAHRVTIEGAGHWVHADQPEAFVRTLTEFVEGDAGTR